jgi:polyisoprenoid-binding protein YceI
MRYDPSNAKCQVFTFKDGLLSKIAHDLRIDVTKFHIDADPSVPSVRAEFDPRSLRVVTAMSEGRDNPTALSDSDKKKIEGQIVDEVLHGNQHDKITFVSDSCRKTDDGYELSGQLTLHGVTRRIQASAHLDGAQHVAELSLNQPDFGVTPFKAMMGTLKVKPEVRVRITLPRLP